MTAYAKHKTTKENVEVPTQAEFEELQAKRVEVQDEATISFSEGAAVIQLLKNVPCQATIPAGSAASVNVAALDTTTFPTSGSMDGVRIFANIRGYESGGLYVLLHGAYFQINNNKWNIRVDLNNLNTASQVSFDGTLDIMMIDMRNA